MKATTSFLAIFAVSALTFSPLALHAQDQGAPPPPMDQGGAPPPQDQGAPPPDQQGAPPPDQGGGGDNASFQDFYDNLSSQGQWVQTPDYGYAFQPTVQDPNWAPYTDGHWVYTTYGWTWASDEPWGWATYHYGRWVNIVGTGWVWVPGYQWAPAWVSWRYGGGYCGWAPLPPSTFVGVEIGGGGINLGFDFQFGNECDTEFGIGPGCYNFIPIGYIGESRYHGYYLDHSRNFVVINNTRNVTNIYVSRNAGNAFSAVRVGGPTLAEVNAQSRTPVQQVRLSAAGQAGAGGVSGGTLSLFRPRINPATLHQARPQTVARTLSAAQVNRGTSVTQPLQVNSHFKPTAPSASAISAARKAQANAPKYVATSTRVAPTVSAASIQKLQTQNVARRQTEAIAQQRAAAAGTTYHPSSTTAPATHSYSATPGQPNTQVNHYNQTESEQTQRQQQETMQERQATAAQQQRESQTEAQQRAATQERTQQPERTPAPYVPQQQEHNSSSSSYTPQHSYQPQPQPQQHSSSPPTQSHSSPPQGGSSAGSNKNQYNNGQNQGQGQGH
jgi:hypothetical protein